MARFSSEPGINTRVPGGSGASRCAPARGGPEPGWGPAAALGTARRAGAVAFSPADPARTSSPRNFGERGAAQPCQKTIRRMAAASPAGRGMRAAPLAPCGTCRPWLPAVAMRSPGMEPSGSFWRVRRLRPESNPMREGLDSVRGRGSVCTKASLGGSARRPYAPTFRERARSGRACGVEPLRCRISAGLPARGHAAQRKGRPHPGPREPASARGRNGSPVADAAPRKHRRRLRRANGQACAEFSPRPPTLSPGHDCE